MVKHVGGAPSVTQKLLIARLARVALRLEIFDQKITDGDLTDHDARVYGALHNAFRLMLREIGLKPTAPRPPTIAEIAAEHRRGAA